MDEQWMAITAWAEAADIDCVEVESPGRRVRLLRGPRGYRIEQAQETPAAYCLAPCAGVFLAEHPARQGALAVVGDQVEAGNLLGLLRLGLLLEPVCAPTRGRVTRLLAGHTCKVDAGARLIEIRTGDPLWKST